MQNLQSIVYVSSAVHLLSDPELEHLLDRARQRNAEKGITGLLLYCDGRFMQYIEGEQQPLLEVFEIIKADDLHEDIQTIIDEPIQSRAFKNWTMAYAKEQLSDFNALLVNQETNDNPNSHQSDFMRLLAGFWQLQP